MNALILFVLAVLLAPLYAGIIQKVKAFFGGRQGAPLLINYYTISKLLKKGSVYSKSTTFIFKVSPVITLGSALFALSFFPIGGEQPLFSFQGDVILIFYILGLARFFMILAALDTVSPFEGMGTSREAYFSIFAEMTLFMTLILFYLVSGELSLAGYFSKTQSMLLWQKIGAPLLLIFNAMYILMLSENSRVPVDDPTTHLELTMIHEVMILDHSGPDLALIEFGGQLKLLFYVCFIASIVFPFQLGDPVLDQAGFFIVVGLVYVSVGITESVMARLKMSKVPKFLLTSFALAFFATIVILEYTP
ncbi:MAG: NADH-quinone oxidoreductase subunit H [SAR324 cluster bacterium]|nr:NADH-quinone oxidoreductase subunit H [SAR324 cluster bacterium]